MRLNEKRYAILRALNMQKYNGGCPSLTLSNRSTASLPKPTEPLNKNARAKKRPMDEAQKMEVFKRTGFFPFVEVLYT
jgi:hypothetical protein